MQVVDKLTAERFDRVTQQLAFDKLLGRKSCWVSILR
jgi:hypothetical protein